MGVELKLLEHGYDNHNCYYCSGYDVERGVDKRSSAVVTVDQWHNGQKYLEIGGAGVFVYFVTWMSDLNSVADCNSLGLQFRKQIIIIVFEHISN